MQVIATENATMAMYAVFVVITTKATANAFNQPRHLLR